MNEISYLKGLLDGLGVDMTSKEGKVYAAICSAMEAMAKRNEELEDRVAELEELCDILDEDLGDIEEFLCDEDDDEEDEEFGCESCMADCMDDDDEEYETVCPTCGVSILLDASVLEEGETVCPNCGEELIFDFDEEEEALLKGEAADSAE